MGGEIGSSPAAAAIAAGRLLQRLGFLLAQSRTGVREPPAEESRLLVAAAVYACGTKPLDELRSRAEAWTSRKRRRPLSHMPEAGPPDDWTPIVNLAEMESRPPLDVAEEWRDQVLESVRGEIAETRALLLGHLRTHAALLALGEHIEEGICPSEPDIDPEQVPPDSDWAGSPEGWVELCRMRRRLGRANRPYGWLPARPGELPPPEDWFDVLCAVWREARLDPAGLPFPEAGLFESPNLWERADINTARQRVEFVERVFDAASTGAVGARRRDPAERDEPRGAHADDTYLGLIIEDDGRITRPAVSGAAFARLSRGAQTHICRFLRDRAGAPASYTEIGRMLRDQPGPCSLKKSSHWQGGGTDEPKPVGVRLLESHVSKVKAGFNRGGLRCRIESSGAGFAIVEGGVSPGRMSNDDNVLPTQSSDLNRLT